MPARAWSVLPLTIFPSCGIPDRTDLCPSALKVFWHLISYVKTSTADNPGFLSEELSPGSGLHADKAWRTKRGRTDIIITVFASGFLPVYPKLFLLTAIEISWRKI